MSDEAERRIAELMRDELGIEPPAPDADVIELGLIDSLSLVVLLSEIESAFAIELPLADLEIDEFRTIRAMAALAARSAPAGSSGP